MALFLSFRRRFSSKAFVILIAGLLAQHRAAADVITDWNSELLQAVRTTSLNPPRASRQMAMMHLAMYDAVNGLAKTHRQYAVVDPAPTGASKEAAASAAAKTVLDSLYSASAPVLASAGARHDAIVKALPAGAALNDGLAWGAKVGQAILALRANDGSNATVPYTAAPAPGVWEPTPPANAAPLLPNWPTVTPFGMLVGYQFRCQPPPDLTSSSYALEVNQTKEIGGAVSSLRTVDQTQIAQFWADGGGTETPPGHWMHIARDVSAAKGLSLEQNARLFALLGIAVADAAITAWDSKYAYNLWRPITAIRKADTDDNPATTADPTWTPLIGTPPFPEYTSGHSTFSRASATILDHFFGGQKIPFTTTSDGLPNVTRSYASFGAAADESGISRIYGGIHFESANIAGQNSGFSLANFVWDNYLAPISATQFAVVVARPGRLVLELQATVGKTYQIEASNDLRGWEELALFKAEAPVVEFTDANSPVGKRFYRAREK